MENQLSIGTAAPNFTLPASGGGELSLKDFAGQKLVLYFYPKDDTSGCTKQAIGFSESVSEFDALGAKVVGISKDSIESHDKFVAKHDLQIPLLSDVNLNVCKAYGVWVEKSMYGRKYMGIERSTFIINAAGKLSQIWRKVKIPDHQMQIIKHLQVML